MPCIPWRIFQLYVVRILKTPSTHLFFTVNCSTFKFNPLNLNPFAVLSHLMTRTAQHVLQSVLPKLWSDWPHNKQCHLSDTVRICCLNDLANRCGFCYMWNPKCRCYQSPKPADSSYVRQDINVLLFWWIWCSSQQLFRQDVKPQYLRAQTWLMVSGSLY